MSLNVLELRTDCTKKHAYLLLSSLLNYYNVPVRKSNEKILEANIKNNKRILTLSYEKVSKGKIKYVIYSVNLVLEGKNSNKISLNSKNIRIDSKNGSIFELFDIKEFSIVVNGEVKDVDYSLLQKLNKGVIYIIDKPMNLGKPSFYNQQIWNRNKCLSPAKESSTDKVFRKILKDFIPKIVDELGYNLKEESIESIHIDYCVETIKGIYYMVANITFSNNMLVSFFFKSAIPLTYYTESISVEDVEWFYVEKVTVSRESEKYKSMYDTVSELIMMPGRNGYFDFNEKLYVSAKKYFK